MSRVSILGETSQRKPEEEVGFYMNRHYQQDVVYIVNYNCFQVVVVLVVFDSYQERHRGYQSYENFKN